MTCRGTWIPAILAIAGAIGPASAEVLAMMNYESKPAEQLKSLKLSGETPRREGIAIVDVDPDSANYGMVISDIPIEASSITHHIFYDRSMTKAYVTGFQPPALRMIELTRNPYRMSVIETPDCVVAEDVVFDEANDRWYLTCMGSAKVVVGEVSTDAIIGEIPLPGTYPHGLAINTDIDRILVTSTITPDLTGPQEVVSVVKASTLEPLSQIKMSEKGSPSGVAPVEVVFAPNAETPTAIVTNMFGHALWALVWDAGSEEFTAEKIFDFTTVGAAVPLEIYFNGAGDRMFVTTAMKPGYLHVFDTSEGPTHPRLLRSIETADGAHHVGFTPDFKRAYVQNSFLNLPDMSDGSVSIVELESGSVVSTMNTLKNAGFNPNSLVLLPEWNDLAGH
ncbi:hypothetical protein [Pikeienuella sp. HZG-20]|uniref:YncE family protein n=1 Tax=Paludibacillus litoralis TaxID=3133267 RepID=UPI0030EC992C